MGAHDEEPGYVEVRRTGGLIGRPATGRVSLDPDHAHDVRVAEVQELAGRVSLGPGTLARVLPTRRHPDMFTFTITVADREPVVLAETQLRPDVRRLVELVLELGETS